MIKNILIFSVGVVVGGLGAAIVLKNRYETILEEEIKSIHEFAATRESRNGSKRVPERHVKENLSSLVKRYGGDVEASEAMSDPEDMQYGGNEEKEYFEYEKMSHNANHCKNNKRVYIISTEQFSEERSDFDKLTISYYEDDDTLVDENEEIIGDPISAVGDALDNFGVDSDDPEIVYVRNEKMAIDYEVIRLSKSYAKTIGIN